MISRLRSLVRTARAAAFPLTRTTLLFLAWKHRYTVMLWFRSIRAELSTAGLEPGRLRVLLRGLWAISNHRRTTNSEPLRRISLRGDGFGVEARDGWIGRATVEHLLAPIGPQPMTMTVA